MNWIKKKWTGIEIKSKTVREFGFILSGFFLLAPYGVGLIKEWLFHVPLHVWSGWIFLSTLSLLANLLAPKLMKLMFHTAMFVAGGISTVMTQIILFLFFYFVLSPISFTMRIIGKDLLDEKIDLSAKTYWKKRDRLLNREQYERLF